MIHPNNVCIGRTRSLLRGDLLSSELVLPFPLAPRHHSPQRLQGYLQHLRASALPHHCGSALSARPRQLMALQRLRDGRQHLRLRHPMGLYPFATIPPSGPAPSRVPWHFSHVLRGDCQSDADCALPSADRLLGQRPQVEQARGQTPRRQV